MEVVRGRHPVTLEGELAPHLSRWPWLVKWLLAIPHAVVLLFLWLVFSILTVIAFFAVLFTVSYPRGIFADVPDYPARLEIDYPENLRRDLSPIGCWLLGIPQYLPDLDLKEGLSS